MDLHNATKDDYASIKKLYCSAFPINERAPFSVIKRRALQNRATMLVAEENGEFVGFAYTVSHKHLVYLFYFAVADTKRGSGNGSEILRLLKKLYSDRQIFLAREPLDESAKNSLDRERRRDFYIRNGFVDLPYQIKEASVVYDLMSTGNELTAEDYNSLIQNWAGKLILMFVNMEFVQ